MFTLKRTAFVLGPAAYVAGLGFCKEPADLPFTDVLYAFDLAGRIMLEDFFRLPLLAQFLTVLFLAAVLEWAIRFLSTRARPYFGEPDVRPYPVKGATGNIESVSVASVPLFNNPRWRTRGAEITNAHVIVDFFVFQTGEFVRRTHGRWADNTAIGQHDSPSNISALKFRNIEPNDSSNLINIAARRSTSAFLYALTPDGWLFGESGSLILRDKELLVRLTVKASNHRDIRASFKLRPDHDSERVIIEKHQEPRVTFPWRSPWRPLDVKA